MSQALASFYALTLGDIFKHTDVDSSYFPIALCNKIKINKVNFGPYLLDVDPPPYWHRYRLVVDVDVM